jgi:hypothetical protein
MWFKKAAIGQEAAVMDRPEEQALNDVDRIAVAVERLRELLLAATRAELRANSPKLATEGHPGQPPLP